MKLDELVSEAQIVELAASVVVAYQEGKIIITAAEEALRTAVREGAVAALEMAARECIIVLAGGHDITLYEVACKDCAAAIRALTIE